MMATAQLGAEEISNESVMASPIMRRRAMVEGLEALRSIRLV